jgi:hypothetical protein
MTYTYHKRERNENREKTELTHCDPIFEPAESVGHQYKTVTSYVECSTSATPIYFSRRKKSQPMQPNHNIYIH